MWFLNALQGTLLILAVGCSARPSTAVQSGRVTNYTNCSLPVDQGRGSFYGQWGSLPVPIVFDRDFYTTDDGELLPSLRAASQTWNNWASYKGRVGFAIQNDGSGATAGADIPELTTCAQGDYSASVTDKVGIWKISNAGYHRNQRDSCGTDSTGAVGRLLATGVQGQTDWITLNGRITGASILLNFEGYNSPGQARVDVESLLLHELGHVLGLLHSCNGSSSSSSDSTTAPACGVASNAYLIAVMFPYLMENQERRYLQQNDYNRINCLY